MRSSVPVELRVVLARLLHLVVPTVHRALGAAGAREEETAVVGSVLRRQPPQFGVLRLAWPSICIRVIVSSLWKSPSIFSLLRCIKLELSTCKVT